MVKTKILKRRVEIKIEKKKHNLIRCKCLRCGKKKWSQYNKRSSKVLCLSIINLIIWTVAIDGITNWYGSRGLWVFENAQAASVFDETSATGEAQSKPIGLEVSGIEAAATESSLAETVGGTQVSSVSGSAIEDKIRQVFHEEPRIAVAIFKGESGLNPYKESDSDRMADGRAFSVGVTQINLTVSEVGGVNCTKAFSGKNYEAKVIDEALYAKCVNLAKDPDLNLEAARKKYEGRKNKFTAWSVYTKGHYEKFL